MLNCFLIDDEPHCTDVLRVLLQKYCPQVQVCGVFNDPEAALRALPQQKPDLVFLDIEMPVLNGFDWLRRCSGEVDFRLIFTTAYDQYAVKAFKFNALDYLLKPIDAQELKNAVEKSIAGAVPALARLDAAEYLQQHPVPVRIGLPVGANLVMTEVADILYCASEGSYVSFFLKNQSRPVVVTKSLREVEELLNNPSVFFRCHNSYLVQIGHIKKIDRTEGGELTMSNDRNVPVARNRKADLLKLIARL